MDKTSAVFKMLDFKFYKIQSELSNAWGSVLGFPINLNLYIDSSLSISCVGLMVGSLKVKSNKKSHERSSSFTFTLLFGEWFSVG